MPRPTDFSEAIADEICELLADGVSLRAMCADNDRMPHRATIFRWLADPAHAAFRDQYARAREAQADALADEIVAIADKPLVAVTITEKMVAVAQGTGLGAELEPVTETRTSDAVDRSRLMVDARKWITARLAPKKYGDKLELAGDADRPLQHVIERIERVIVDPKHDPEDPNPAGV